MQQMISISNGWMVVVGSSMNVVCKDKPFATTSKESKNQKSESQHRIILYTQRIHRFTEPPVLHRQLIGCRCFSVENHQEKNQKFKKDIQSFQFSESERYRESARQPLYNIVVVLVVLRDTGASLWYIYNIFQWVTRDGKVSVHQCQCQPDCPF